MKVFAVIFTSFFLVGSADARADSTASPAVVVTDKVSHASFKGSADTFTGSVQIEPLFPAKNPSRVSGGLVTFEPGARSAWHTHPLGQTLIITSAGGWVQEWGGQKREMKAGDVVSIPPGVKHWHGATASTGVSHIAIQETLDGKNVQWMEKVSDEQYSQ